MGNRTRQSFHFGRLAAMTAAFAAVSVLSTATEAQAVRDYISIVGSSTVYPFATVVAEQFGRKTSFKTPKIEPTGSGGGIKAFCDGIGVQYPDIANSSRRITATEVANCKSHGVDAIVEVKIGYDGIVLANAKTTAQMDVTLRELYLALAKNVPDPAGGEKLVPNPYRRWSEINPRLPDENIEVLGPPPTSGTRDAFLELAMEPGCKSVAWVAALPREEMLTACHMLRDDGGYVEAGENDNLIVQKLVANPRAFGVFGFSFLEQNADKVQGAEIDGIAPDFDAIADGQYPISRPLYFYVKKAHVDVIPGIREYLKEFTSDSAWGEFGYLSDKGLIPLADDERREVTAAVQSLADLNLAAAH